MRPSPRAARPGDPRLLGRALGLVLLAALASLPTFFGPSASPSGPPASAAARRRAASAAAALGASAASAARAGADGDEEIVVVYTVCGNPNEVEEDLFGLVSLKSLLMAKAQRQEGARPRHYSIHLLTNIDAEELFNTTVLNWEVYRAFSKDPRVRVTLHHVDELDAAADAFGVHAPRAIPHNVFKNCASSRLKLPFLLARLGIQKAIYIDWDTVILCDLSMLWLEFARFAPGASLGFAQSDPTGVSNLDHYREWSMARHPTAGSINSGVMLVDVAELMAQRDAYWATIESIMLGGVNVTAAMDAVATYWAFTKKFPLGDQDVLNAFLARLPAFLHVLPPAYNHCLEYQFVEELPPEATAVQRAAAANRRMPCILHFCGSKLLPTKEGEATLPCTNSWKAAHMFVKHWQLERGEAAPGRRPQPEPV